MLQWIKRRIEKIEKFRHIFLYISIILGLLFFFSSLHFRIFLFLPFRVSLWYVFSYSIFILITFILIIKVSEVNETNNIDKREFFKFITVYLIIIIVYIIFFSLLFFLTYKLSVGFLISNNGIKPLEDYMDFLFFSGITFVSYDIGIFPVRLMKLLVFIELFASQIIILGFLFIIFGDLLNKIKRKL